MLNSPYHHQSRQWQLLLLDDACNFLKVRCMLMVACAVAIVVDVQSNVSRGEAAWRYVRCRRAGSCMSFSRGRSSCSNVLLILSFLTRSCEPQPCIVHMGAEKLSSSQRYYSFALLSVLTTASSVDSPIRWAAHLLRLKNGKEVQPSLREAWLEFAPLNCSDHALIPTWTRQDKFTVFHVRNASHLGTSP